MYRLILKVLAVLVGKFHFVSSVVTPNCNNVVIEKSKKQKAKRQIGIN